jgi:AcrR family transcriptional regulator
VSLKRLYQLFPSKDALVCAFLHRRDVRWRGRLAAFVEQRTDPDERLLAVFDWLGEWFAEPGFRGCAFVNAFGEMGATSGGVLTETVAHKELVAVYIAGLVADAGRPPSLAGHLVLLAEGAMTTAAFTGTTEAARDARAAAGLLMSLEPVG